MDRHIQRLVCKRCWDTVFSYDTFLRIWATAADPAQSPGYSYCSPSWGAMQRSIDHMCEWCDLVCEEIQFYYRHKTKSRGDPPPEATFQLTVQFVHKPPQSLYLKLTVGDWTPKWLIYSADDSPAGRYITTRDVLRQIGVKGEHSYVTLSYVWGEDQPFKTTTKNIEKYTRGIDISRVPQTIRDAITVTHRLGLRFLWVDAYCIIQDSKEDKAEQISHMRDIFHHAYVTIIAACASKVSDGFLHDRRPGFPAPSTLPFRTPDGALGTMFLSHGTDLRPEPVNSRAWCLEERVLSPRSLVYCSHTLQYECQTEHMNIDRAADPRDVRDDIVQLPSWVFHDRFLSSPFTVPGIEDAERILDNTWRKIISCYTQRTLTKPGDRLIAVSGLVQKLHQHWPKGQEETPVYHAGLWSHHIPGCLMWTVPRRKFPRPATYRSPSWSWGAVDGEIQYASRDVSNMICEVHCCRTFLAREEHPYGKVIGGMLILRAMVRRAIWDPENGNLFELHEVLAAGEYHSEEQGDDGEIGYVTADALEPASSSVGEVYLAILMKTDMTVQGLVMERDFTTGPSAKTAGIVEQKETAFGIMIETFRRLGTFTAPFCDRDIWFSTPSQVIQII
ncbi:hypothetical protein AtubIFM56815_005104 [Aspergillus tubingensis]|uniref:Heterokaryon incompatibility domain-containing protein n=1 Tax=Aspergillus tubingensis TaxID=5068 RepID=A0A9W6AGH5_ASPTU|nr:hypothetical protein AtubIFM56815_005104 [Aspergillus tubingensis]